jgi:hypothetical protein
MKFVLVAAILALSRGCAAPAAPPPADGDVALAPGVSLRLPSPATLGRNVEAMQWVAARHRDNVVAFEARIAVNGDSLVLVGSDAMGRRLLTLRRNGDGPVVADRADWLPPDLRPENILADILLIYWPEAALRPRLKGATLGDAEGVRSIRRDGAEIIRIVREGNGWSGRARLDNLAWSYDLDIRSAEATP